MSERNLTLYDLTNDFNKLMDAESDDEITNALIEIASGEIEKKAESYCKFLATVESTIEQFKAEEKRIADARKSLENKVKRAKERMKECLLAANIDKVSAGTFKISIRLSPGTVEIDDLEQIPQKFLTVIPQQYVPDKNAIKTAIKAGEEVPGAHIEAGTMMTIR